MHPFLKENDFPFLRLVSLSVSCDCENLAGSLALPVLRRLSALCLGYNQGLLDPGKATVQRAYAEMHRALVFHVVHRQSCQLHPHVTA